MSSLRFGVLGAANIAYKYTAQAIIDAPGTSLGGVAARDRARAEEFAARFSCPVFDTYEALIESDQIDAVYIPLPIALHSTWAQRALEAGKHVLCEKSLAESYEAAKPMIDTARSNGLVLVENFMCERHPQNELAQRMIADGKLGRVQQLSLSFGFPPFAEDDLKYSAPMGGGALNDAGAYCVDMASYYLQAKPVSVWAVLDQRDAQVDIVGTASLAYGDGTVAQLSFGFENDYRNEARLWGASGQLTIDRSFSIPPERVPSVTLVRNTVATQLEVEPANHFIRTMQLFGELVDGGDTAAVLDKIEMQAMIMEGARRSARDGRVVHLDDEFEGWSALRPWTV